MTIFKRERLGQDVQVQEVQERYCLSEQVYERRETIGWAQEKLAEHASMTQAQIATIEAGQANPTLRTLIKLAHALGCRVKDLLAPVQEEPQASLAVPEASYALGGSYSLSMQDLVSHLHAARPWGVSDVFVVHTVKSLPGRVIVHLPERTEPSDVPPATRRVATVIRG